MTPRSGGAPALALLLLLMMMMMTAACGNEGTERLPTPRNVVLISLDSLRADHVGCYGYEKETTPRLDALARQGVRFAQAVAETSWTLPAHATLFTGVPSARHGVTLEGRLGKRFPTLAGELQRHGFRTRGFWSGPYLHPFFGLGQGFAEGDYEGVIETSYDDLGAVRSTAELTQARDEANRQSHLGTTSQRLVEGAVDFLEQAGSEPFFLFVHFFDIHYDYHAPEEDRRRFDPTYEGDLDATGFIKNTAIHPDMDPRDLEYVVSLYDAEIAFTDRWVGVLLDELERLGFAEDTLVVVTSDHGEEFFEHGAKGHRKALYEESLAVPLILAGPGTGVPGRSPAEPVHHMDVAPTILDLLGLPVPGSMVGTSLAPLLRGDSLSDDRLLPSLLVQSKRRRQATLRGDGWKALWTERRGEEQLQVYDLRRDPGEREPESLSADDPRTGRIRAALQHYGLTTDSVPTSGDIPEALQAQLRELGYIK